MISLEKRLNELVEVLLSYARLEFDAKVSIESDSITDFLGLAINMLGEELKASCVSTKYFDGILQAGKEMRFVVNSDWKIEWTNRQAMTTLGYDKGDFKEGSFIKFVSSDESISEYDAFVQLMTSEIARDYAICLICRNGITIPVRISAGIIETDLRNERKIVLSAIDVSESRTLSRMNSDLEFALRSTQNNLIQASKLSSLGTMASGMCHELNNPLTTVKGFAEIIANSANLNEDEKLKMKKIQTAAERMRAIVDHLRVFSRAPNEMDKKTVNVKAPIMEAIDFFESQLKFANIKTSLEIESEVAICGDHNQIESIFHNLIGDSRDAFQNITDGREKFIRIRVDMRPDNQIGIKYEDNACGMLPEVAVKIFDPFFTTKTQGEGTGLGLTVSHGIVARHGGNITVESEIGKGTSFLITLPCVPV